MSRIYSNEALSNLPVTSVRWNGVDDFDQSKIAVFSRDKPGILLEGKIVSQARISITNSSDTATTKNRYYLLNIDVEKAHKRKFDDRGNEVEPNFSETTKVSTGYLNSSYDVKARGNTDRLSKEDAVLLVQNADVSSMIQNTVTKGIKGDVTLLIKEAERDKLDLPDMSFVRIKTLGESPFIETLVVRDQATSTSGNFVGDQVIGSNWTEKIMAAKSANSASKDMEDSEIADDEWDD